MSSTVKEINSHLETIAPKVLAYEWDNCGLLVGRYDKEVSKVLVCLDVTNDIVKRACDDNIDLVVSHHPFIMESIKSVSDGTQKGKAIIDLIKNDISVISLHTNLDIANGGLNDSLAKKLKLKSIEGYKVSSNNKLYKVAVFVPLAHKAKVMNAMCGKGAGWIGNYSDCTFSSEGIGTFRPLENTKPFIGETGRLEEVNEVKIETAVLEENLNQVLKAMKEAHPYEEVAYDVYLLKNSESSNFLGRVGTLEKEFIAKEFAKYVKQCLGIECVRLIGDMNTKIKRVAVSSGSFDGDLGMLLKKDIDIIVTGDIKYHTARNIEEINKCAVDCGHFGTEHLVVDLLEEILKNKFEKIEIIKSKDEKDPYMYI